MDVRLLIATCGGLGFLRPAPGTWGSLPPAALLLGIVLFAGSVAAANLALIVLALTAIVACIAVGQWVESALGVKDPSAVVIDEVAGMSLALLFIPLDPLGLAGEGAGGLAAGGAAWISPIIVVGATFILFRIADIVKPPPANAMQQFPAGWGILLDDLFAGVYANIAMQLVLRFGLPALAGSQIAAAA